MVALAELIPYAIALVCLALAAIITVLVVSLFRWLIDLLNQIPTVDIGTGWLDTVEQSVTNALGTAFGWVNKEVGASFHQLARFGDWLWDELRAHADLLLELASGILPIAVAVRALKSLIHHLTATSTVGSARVKALEKEYAGIDKELRTLKKEYHGIDQLHVRHRLGKIEAQLGTIEAQTIPAIRQAEHDASSAISNLYEWAKGKASLLGVGTFSLAVATAIGMDAFNGLRCKQWGGLNRKWGCGLGSLLDDLLGIVVAGIVLESVCEFLPLVEDAFGAVAGPLVHVLNEVPLGACEQLPTGWSRLHVAAGPLPPQQTFGTLAA